MLCHSEKCDINLVNRITDTPVTIMQYNTTAPQTAAYSSIDVITMKVELFYRTALVLAANRVCMVVWLVWCLGNRNVEVVMI